MDYEGPSILMTSVRMPNRKDKDEEITWRTLTSPLRPSGPDVPGGKWQAWVGDVMCGRSPSRCFQGFSITMRTTRCTWATSCGHRIDFRILRGEDNFVDYASYLVNTSVRGSWFQRARLGVVTELMIPAQCPRMLKDRRGGRHVLRRLPREPRPGVPDREWQGVGGGHHGAGGPPPSVPY